MATDYSKYTKEEICTFLKIWGTGFKSLDYQVHEQAEAYYQACLDAYEHLQEKPLRYYTVEGLRRTLLLIAQDFMIEYKSKRQNETYLQRSELCTYIANHLLESKNSKVVQASMF